MFFIDIWLEMVYTINNKDGTMKTLMKFLETVYSIMYLFVAVVAAFFLYPLSFLYKKDHHEESGYDL